MSRVPNHCCLSQDFPGFLHAAGLSSTDVNPPGSKAFNQLQAWGEICSRVAIYHQCKLLFHLLQQPERQRFEPFNIPRWFAKLNQVQPSPAGLLDGLEQPVFTNPLRI